MKPESSPGESVTTAPDLLGPGSENDDASAHAFDRDYWQQHWQARPGSAPSEGDHRADGPGGAARLRVPSPVNPYLVVETDGLSRGSALDAGCGGGVEAVWLASRGWQVTAADISAVALDRARAFASAAGTDDVSGRVRWVEADLETWEPGCTFDLVTTHYAHPVMPQLDFYERIASWVAPGGTLLVVGHLDHDDGSDSHHDHLRHHDSGSHHDHGRDGGDGGDLDPPRKATTTAAAITARLDLEVWEIVTAEEVSRTIGAPDGSGKLLQDVIVRARRRR